MIKSDAQLQRTEAQIEGFRQTAAELERTLVDRPAEVREAVISSHQAMIQKLQAQVARYQELKRGVLRLPRLASLKDYGAQLPRFRIALGLTQEALAEMVGVARQTINKHEEQEYQAAPLVLVAQVSDALGVVAEIAVRHKKLTIHQPADPRRPAGARKAPRPAPGSPGRELRERPTRTKASAAAPAEKPGRSARKR